MKSKVKFACSTPPSLTLSPGSTAFVPPIWKPLSVSLQRSLQLCRLLDDSFIHSLIHLFIAHAGTEPDAFCPDGDCSPEGSGDPWNWLPHRRVEGPRNGQTQESEEVDQGAFVSQGASERWLEGQTSRLREGRGRKASQKRLSSGRNTGNTAWPWLIGMMGSRGVEGEIKAGLGPDLEGSCGYL